MSALVNVPSLLHLCVEYYLTNLELLLGDHLVMQTLSSEHLDHVLEQIIGKVNSLLALDWIIRFISLYGSRITKVVFSIKIRRLAEDVDLNEVSAKSHQLLALMGDKFNENIFSHLDIYEHPLQLNQSQLCNVIQKWNQLVHVRLIIDNLDDGIIKTVSLHCPNLRELHLFGTNYSDSSLRLLAGISEEHNNNGCPKLREISFFQDGRGGSKFSVICVTDLLLQLRELMHLQIPYNMLGEALIILMTHDNGNTRLNLTDIDVNFASIQLHRRLRQNAPSIKRHCEGDILGRDSFAHGIATSDLLLRADFLCALACLIPNLHKLNITLPNESEIHQLTVLSRFDKLTALSLSIEISHLQVANELALDNAILNQSERWLNRLLAYVPGLTELELQNISSVDIGYLSSLYPNLKRLQISNVKRLRWQSQDKQGTHYEQLVELVLCGHFDAHLDEFCLQQLLCSCVQVQVLTLGWCAEVTDQLMQRVLQRNAMRCLQRLELHELSDKLTIALVHQLVFTRTRPLLLNVYACNGIDRTDMVALANEIKAQNRNVILKYYDL